MTEQNRFRTIQNVHGVAGRMRSLLEFHRQALQIASLGSATDKLSREIVIQITDDLTRMADELRDWLALVNQGTDGDA